MKLGLIDMLEQSANALEREAASIKRRNVDGRGQWSGVHPEDRHAHDEMRGLAKQLRKAAAYHIPNPLGGPAVIFDACADRIRAGEDIESAMRDFGVALEKAMTQQHPNGVKGPEHG